MTSEEIDRYTRREYAIDCPQMVLRQDTDNSPETYRGAGSIYQTPEGALVFKLYDRGKGSFAAFARKLGPNSPKSGEIIPRDDYFTLEATSMHGDIWRGERILPELTQGVGGDRVVAGRLYRLVRETNDPLSNNRASYLSLHFAHAFDFPGNTPQTVRTFLRGVEVGMSGDWAHALFDAASLKFEIHEHRGTVFLAAESKNANLPPNLDMRISEALEFVFFLPLRWVVQEKSEAGRYTTCLRPHPKKIAKRYARPPIQFSTVSIKTDVWNLFAKYLEFVLPHLDARWHPLSERVHLVATGDAGSLDAGLLALSVAVEGALSIGFPNLANSGSELDEQIAKTTSIVSGADLTDSFKQRLTGALAAMRAPRAKDRLRALVAAGSIRKELMDRWASLRNSTVHASDADPAEIRALYRRYQSALTLFNELVMLVIGYSGEYTDYSTSGWPARTMEVRSSAATQAI
ncbi:MAG: hypothetical protein WBQ34_06600 [Candidatus Acidiferrales bacterium]